MPNFLNVHSPNKGKLIQQIHFGVYNTENSLTLILYDLNWWNFAINLGEFTIKFVAYW